MEAQGNGNVLIVDDEFNAVRVLSAILSEEGYRVIESQQIDKALHLFCQTEIDAVITDVKMPGMGGVELFEYLRHNHPEIPVIFLTAFGTVESAVNAMNCGAFHYFIKPPDYAQLKSVIAKAVEQRQVAKELKRLKGQVSADANQYRIIGKSQKTLKVLEIIDEVKDASSSMLITGETGTGKELIARTLHYESHRKDKPFVAVNCAAIPRELIESELFGSEKGAFTGAHARRIGKFEEASGGTILLDEVAELQLSLQAKLLRVLQEKEIERLGSNKRLKVDFRLMSSTNRDLKNEVAAGTFREDLFYRINVLEIRVPPLRERIEDIPSLTRQFVSEFCAREQKVVSVSEEVMEVLQSYPWPGNVRQLRNVIERAVVFAKGSKIGIQELPQELRSLTQGAGSTKHVTTLKELEFQAIKESLELCGGNKSKAARCLGISRKAFYKKLKELSTQ